jgi:3-oxoacyl-(acyl-carrier-protein) synthase
VTRRVAITGIGVVSALGPDAAAFWDALAVQKLVAAGSPLPNGQTA